MNNYINIDKISASLMTSIYRACEKKSVNSVFYDYIFTYPAL